MKPHIKVEFTVGQIQNMTDEQFAALRDNVCVEGKWETADELRVVGTDPLGVMPMFGSPAREMMFIGIEKDGYTHS